MSGENIEWNYRSVYTQEKKTQHNKKNNKSNLVANTALGLLQLLST